MSEVPGSNDGVAAPVYAQYIETARHIGARIQPNSAFAKYDILRWSMTMHDDHVELGTLRQKWFSYPHQVSVVLILKRITRHNARMNEYEFSNRQRNRGILQKLNVISGNMVTNGI